MYTYKDYDDFKESAYVYILFAYCLWCDEYNKGNEYGFREFYHAMVNDLEISLNEDFSPYMKLFLHKPFHISKITHSHTEPVKILESCFMECVTHNDELRPFNPLYKLDYALIFKIITCRPSVKQFYKDFFEPVGFKFKTYINFIRPLYMLFGYNIHYFFGSFIISIIDRPGPEVLKAVAAKGIQLDDSFLDSLDDHSRKEYNKGLNKYKLKNGLTKC